jgi:hypothetical protein
VLMPTMGDATRFDDGFLLRSAQKEIISTANDPNEGSGAKEGSDSKAGAHLFIQFANDSHKIELLPISATEFTAADIPDVITFERNAQGQGTHLLSNVDEVGRKIE